jgi:hypothetical protein
MIRFLAPAAFVAAVFTAAPSTYAVAPAASFANTSWTLNETDKLSAPGRPAVKSSHSGLSFAVDSTGASFTLTDPAGNLQGTLVAKGKRGFKATFDQASLDTAQNYMVSQIQSDFGFSNVTVKSFRVTTTGSTDKTGALLKIKHKISLRGSATVGGRRYPGTVTFSSTESGTKI